MQNWVKSLIQGVAIIAGISFVFSWFGVYNTGSIPFLPRFGFWSATMVVGYGGGYFAIPVVRGQLSHLPVPLQVILLAAIISIPVTLLLMIISSDPWSFYKFGVQFIYVFVVSLVLTIINWVIDDLRIHKQEQSQEDPVAAFLERLPVKYRTAELYAISAEDHYLRVHTSLGEELILMRLADALRELADADGLQTHRSWWVASSGVADAVKQQGKQFLILKSGERAAVSRTYAGAVKTAGLS